MGRMMRKQKKEELIEMIKTLQSAMDENINLIKEQRYEELLDLLADCQGGAIAVGTAIDEAEQTDTKAVRMLEELCEMIYECSMENDEQEKIHICKNMQTKLRQIEDEIQRGIKTQKMVVFLPYKASMWDSLESVWKASDEDEEWLVGLLTSEWDEDLDRLAKRIISRTLDRGHRDDISVILTRIKEE